MNRLPLPEKALWIYDHLQDEIVSANRGWNLWKDMSTNDEVVRKLNDRVPLFFAYTQEALLHFVVSSIARSVDEKRTSVWLLMDEARRIDPQVDSELADVAAEVKVRTKAVVKFRHETVAHSNTRVLLQQIPAAELSRDDVEGALETLGKLMNQLERRYETLSAVTYARFGEGEITRLLELLR